jgi:hypothetical protein
VLFEFYINGQVEVIGINIVLKFKNSNFKKYTKIYGIFSVGGVYKGARRPAHLKGSWVGWQEE